MDVAIVTTGDEVMSGNIVDTNTAWISDKCWVLGHRVTWHASVGDDMGAIGDALKLAADRAEVVFVSGGLGATVDDITLSAAAKAFNKKMIFHEDIWRRIQDFFSRVNRECSENNKKQARILEGGKPLANMVGTAPGVQVKLGRAVFFFLPGVPKELKQIFDDSILPWLKERSAKVFYTQKFLRCFGLPEASFDQKIKGLELGDVRLSFRVTFPEVKIKLVARVADELVSSAALTQAESAIRVVLGDYIYGVDDERMEGVIGRLLTQKRMTLAVAESCTGGLIANKITDVPGASKYFERGLVTYSNQSKMDILGVKKETLEKFGAVSQETSIEMAEGVKNISGASIGLSVTGIAGPSGGTAEKPVGTVHIALASHDGTEHKEYHYQRDREWFKLLVAMTSLDMLRRYLIKN